MVSLRGRASSAEEIVMWTLSPHLLNNVWGLNGVISDLMLILGVKCRDVKHSASGWQEGYQNRNPSKKKENLSKSKRKELHLSPCFGPSWCFKNCRIQFQYKKNGKNYEETRTPGE